MSVEILTSSRFRKLLSQLSSRERAAVDAVVEELVAGFGAPHAHLGLGIRKLAGGLFEVRVGLHLRMLFWFEHGTVILHFIGNHDAVRAFLGKGK